jgi:hypothetical protein
MTAHDCMSKRQFPVTETGELFHGTTDERAKSIEANGFTTPTTYLTPHRDLAQRYAEGRVTADGGGTPTVLRTDPVHGVSAAETGYSSPDLNREEGADYMDKGPEVLVLHPNLLKGIRRA